MMALVITNVALVITNVALVMYIVYIIVKFQKSNYQSCIGNNQCLNDNNQFRICRYQLLTNWLLPMQDWLLPNVFLARRNNQFSMPYYQCMVLQWQQPLNNTFKYCQPNNKKSWNLYLIRNEFKLLFLAVVWVTMTRCQVFF